HHGAGGLVVDVEIAGRVAQFFGGQFHGVAVVGENGAGEGVRRCLVYGVQNFLEFISVIHVQREHRPEQLVAHGHVLRVLRHYNGGFNKVAFALVISASGDDLDRVVIFGGVQVAGQFVKRFFVDDGV